MTSSAETQATTSQGPYHDLVVHEVIDETADARSVVFDVPEDLRALFAYDSGQFLTFRVEVDGHRLVRCYSLASSPVTERLHKVTIKRVADGRVSNWFNDNVRAGSTLEVMKPAGHFCLQGRDTPIVLFGGGSGITPVISILKTAIHTTSRKVKLVYANRDEQSVIFKDELAELLAAHGDRLEIVHRLDDQHGFVNAEQVESFVGGLTAADFYICGPGPFMDVVEGTLERLQVPAAQIFIERFESPDEPPVPVPVHEHAAGEEAPVLASIGLDGETQDVPCEEGETILAAARRAGMEPPFACEDGYCGCCMAMVKEGEVEMIHNDGGVDDNQISQGWVLTCQGVPKSKRVRIEYPE